LLKYTEVVNRKIKQSIQNQVEKFEKASNKLAEAVKQDGILHVLGSGHSHILAEEIFYRAGGPVFVNPILDSSIMLHEGPIKSTQVERLPGYAKVLLDNVDIKKHDICLIVSNSGRNALPIEAAYYMRERGIFTISISSFKHSQSVSSRHKSGKRLFEITDLSFDNYGEIGDAALSVPASEQKYGPTSSIVGIAIVQTLISMTIEKLVERGEDPDIIRSANLDGSDEINNLLIDKYKSRIPLLR